MTFVTFLIGFTIGFVSGIFFFLFLLGLADYTSEKYRNERRGK